MPLRAKACRSEPISCRMSLRHSSNQALPLEKKKALSHPWLPAFSLWDGTNVTYGRHHAATEWLSSPGTNNSVAKGLIKRNGTNYGPIPSCTAGALVWPRQPDQQRVGGWAVTEREGEDVSGDSRASR